MQGRAFMTVPVPHHPARATSPDPSGPFVFADVDIATKRVTRLWHQENDMCPRGAGHFFASPLVLGNQLVLAPGSYALRAKAQPACVATPRADVIGLRLE